jgi:hypothetical protein
MQHSPDWHRSRSTYLVGRSELDGVDSLAGEMEAKWGVGRLRLLVPAEWREKFDRQRYMLNQAIWHGGLEDVRQQSTRMVAAWRKLDALATAAGAVKLDPDLVWEIALDDGTVAAVVPSVTHTGSVRAEGRAVAVYTLEEIARLLSLNRTTVEAKLVFPGATVVGAPRDIRDPLDGIADTQHPIDAPLFADDLDDVLPMMMEAG